VRKKQIHTPEVNRKLQADFRARKKALGYEELRGVFVPKELHRAIKDYAKELLSRRSSPQHQTQQELP
jgi:hypothetical protein